MNASLLLTHFDRVSDLDAIPRVRRFILDLAVRGKLVEQDPNDEPVLLLLKRIDAERQKLVKEGKIKRQNEALSVVEGYEPFSIPSTWAWTRLGRIGDWGSGSTPPRGSDEYYGGAITWLKSGELNDNPQLAGSEETVTELAVSEGSFRRNEAGDVLIAMYGATIGKVAILGEPAVTNQAVCGCTPFDGVYNRYLFTFLLSQRAELHSASEGGAQPNISKVKIVGFPFPLPPLAEQHRIVTKVNQLMGLCDRLELAQKEREGRRDRLTAACVHHLNNRAGSEVFRERAQFYFVHLPQLTTRPDQIKQLRQAILNLAVCGRLIQQDPCEVTAPELVVRLQKALAAEYQTKSFRGRKPLLSLNTDILSGVAFPPSWAVTDFDTVNAIVSGVAKGKDLRGLKTTSVPYLRVANVQRGYLDLNVIKEIEVHVDEIQRYLLRSGDVLMTEGGDWDKLGRAAIWNEEIPNCIHQNHIYRIRPAIKDELMPSWVVLFANSSLGRSYFEKASKQTTNLASINMTQLRSCPLPIPPTSEQRRIVAKVDELMALCDRLEAKLSMAQTESRRLLEVILHEALNHSAVHSDRF